VGKTPIFRDEQFATIVVKLTQQKFEQTRFATTIATNNANVLAWVDGEAAALDEASLAAV
jgi:hypothetical protein